jgi:Phage integrase family
VLPVQAVRERPRPCDGRRAEITITSFLRKEVSAMSQQGQLIRLKRTVRDGEPLWAYRYRMGGRDSKRVQRGGFASERDAAEALERELERLRRERRVSRSLTVAELVEAYLAQHDVEQVTIEKLRWLLGKAVAAFGERPVGELRGSGRLADRALTRLPLRRDAGAAAGARTSGRLGDDGRQPGQARRRQPDAAAQGTASVRVLGRTRCHRRASRARHSAMVIFAAATGLRPAEWLALEWRDLDPEARVVYVHRSFTKGRLKCPKTEASRRAVPLQTIALEAIEQQLPSRQSALLFPAERGGYLDLHNFRNREWKPAQVAAGFDPLRRVYDLRHTFATFALRAGISTFDLSRYMGASLTMIDRHYGHLARDGRDHAINLLDSYSRPDEADVHQVDVAWTLQQRAVATSANRRRL